VTYEEATRWLKEIGGTAIVAKEQQRGLCRVTVIAEDASGRMVSRHTIFDDSLTGVERERVVRHALTQACEALKIALET
jgi:hypothetical protein